MLSTMSLQAHKTRVKGACRRQEPAFFKFIQVWGGPLLGQKWLKLTSEKAGIGLRRESVDFPDIRKVETLILVILDLN